jgi:hypothetical protein
MIADARVPSLTISLKQEEDEFWRALEKAAKTASSN